MGGRNLGQVYNDSGASEYINRGVEATGNAVGSAYSYVMQSVTGYTTNNIKEVFDEGAVLTEASLRRSVICPPCDVYVDEASQQLCFVIEAAGLNPENMSLIITEDYIYLKAKKVAPKIEGLYISNEIIFGMYERKVSIPPNCKVVEPTTYEGGLLKIRIQQSNGTQN